MYSNKEIEVDRLDVLYDPARLENLHERFAPETEIKRNVKTSAKTYEIRTALRYWFGGVQTHRTSSVLWYRLHCYEHEGLEPEECEKL